MSNEHEHTWEPASELGLARYRCVCGWVAYRNYKGAITPCAQKSGPAYLRADEERGYGRQRSLGRLPSLDDYDRVRRD